MNQFNQFNPNDLWFDQGAAAAQQPAHSSWATTPATLQGGIAGEDTATTTTPDSDFTGSSHSSNQESSQEENQEITQEDESEGNDNPVAESFNKLFNGGENNTCSSVTVGFDHALSSRGTANSGGDDPDSGLDLMSEVIKMRMEQEIVLEVQDDLDATVRDQTEQLGEQEKALARLEEQLKQQEDLMQRVMHWITMAQVHGCVPVPGVLLRAMTPIEQQQQQQQPEDEANPVMVQDMEMECQHQQQQQQQHHHQAHGQGW